MLGKLLKHEFKQSSRIILIILAILVVITPITALYTRFNMNRVPDTVYRSLIYLKRFRVLLRYYMYVQ